jgi:peptidyl-prolyl cis-trans isomerase D
MLNVLRENFKNRPYLKWLLLVVAFSFVLYLGNYFFFDGSPRQPGSPEDWAARVNDQVIPAAEFLAEARSRDAYYRQLFGEQYEAMKPKLRLGQQVVQALIANELMVQEAQKLGMTASPAEVTQAILADPSFRDSQGSFIGKERYARLVERQYRGGVPAFEDRLAREVAARKWRELVTEPVTVTAGEVEDLFRRQNEKTGIDYVVVRASDQELDLNVSDQELREFYQRHPDRYRRPEGRNIRVVLVDRQALMKDITISDAEITGFYQTNQARYSRPDQRRARHILFRPEPGAPPATVDSVRGEAEKALERVRGGEDFAMLAKALSADRATADAGGDLGYFGRGQMVGAFEQAVFGTPVGQFAPVVQTEFGFHVIQVTDARAAGVAPQDEVQEGIRRELELRRAQELVDESAARVRRDAATGAELERAASRQGLAVQTMTVRRDDRLGELGPSQEFLNAVFTLEPGKVSDPLGVAKGKAVVVVDEAVPAAVAPFEEVATTKVKSDVLNERLRDAARERAEAALRSGGDVRAAARALGLDVKSSGDLAPGDTIPGTGGNSPELERTLFGPGAVIGRRGVVGVPGGSLVYEITRREPLDREKFEQTKDALRGQLLDGRRNALLQSLLNELLKSYRVEINQALVQRVGG